jgi:hypothetical protein
MLIVVRLSVIILGTSLLSIVAPLKLRLMLASKSKTNPNHSLSLSHNCKNILERIASGRAL